MFYYIKGTAAHKGESYAVIDTGGVGYKIYTSQNSLNKISLGEEATMYTHLYLREGIMDIYGFTTNDELGMFLSLISVNGVGPKAALSLLSVTSTDKFILAVLTDDVKTLTKAPGIGAKTAQRIIVELKDKMSKMSSIPESISISESGDTGELSVRNEAVQALCALGYSLEEAKKAVYSLDDGLEIEDMIKMALKNMMK